MKYIFDFDDVIFWTTRHRLNHMFPLLEKAGISRDEIEKYYQRTRLEGFSLRSIIRDLVPGGIDKERLYEDIMGNSDEFVNRELVETIRKLGKENCFLVTHGGKEFQEEKIRRAGASQLFSEMIILVGSKKEAVERICEKFKDEKVIFIDDKPQYFEDLDYKKYPNLKTVLYIGQNLTF